MEEAREKALQEVTDHYETRLEEKDRQREQVTPDLWDPLSVSESYSLTHTLSFSHCPPSLLFLPPSLYPPSPCHCPPSLLFLPPSLYPPSPCHCPSSPPGVR